MEAQPSSDDDMLQGQAYGCLDLQGSMQLHHEQKQCMFQLPSACGLVENEKHKTMVIEDDVTDYAEQGMLERNEVGKSEDGSPWQRMKWTGKMVKLLITILSYIGEDPSTNCVGNQKKMSYLLRKLGKWKFVSKVMVRRGYHVSPQQCEDKFNNLNKTYRRLNDLLGRGTSCKVVENPKLLDIIDVSEKEKEDVRKILTSKHLFFEEMCSYHNGNRFYLPHDPDLLQSLLLILKNEDDYELHNSNQPVLDSNDEKAGAFAEGDAAEVDGATSVFPEFPEKRLRLVNGDEIAGVENQTLDAQGDTAERDCTQNLDPQPLYNFTHWNLCCAEGNEADASQNQQMACKLHQLEKQKLQLKFKVLKLKKELLKWQHNCWKQDMELDNMRLENKCLKLGNDFIAMQLKRKMDLERD